MTTLRTRDVADEICRRLPDVDTDTLPAESTALFARLAAKHPVAWPSQEQIAELVAGAEQRRAEPSRVSPLIELRCRLEALRDEKLAGG